MATFLRILLLAAVACTVTPPGLAASLSATQRALRDQTIFISVQDKQGKPPATLALTDVSIREDGNVREILKIEPATTPMQIAVLVDTSQASQGSIPDMRDAVRAFAAAIWARSPESQIALYTFGERPSLATDYTTSAVALGRGVDMLFAASGSGAYFIDAVIESSQTLAKRKPARGVVVAFVDENGPEFSNRRHEQAFDALANARASLWTITRQGFSNNAMSTESRERGSIIGDVTARTGGRSAMIFAPSALKDRFTEVASHLLAQFAVTYGRPESLIPPERLDVRLTRDGYRLHAPRWTNK
jgi:VWFA-related protein